MRNFSRPLPATSRSATRCRSISIPRSTPARSTSRWRSSACPTAGRVAPLGAASLLYSNSEEHWPDEAGDDLSSLYPGIALLQPRQRRRDDRRGVRRAADAARRHRRAHAHHAHDRRQRPAERLRQPAQARSARADRARTSLEAYDFLVDTLRGRCPNGTLIVTTVYDPSDGTGQIPGVYDDRGPLPLDVLDRLNDHIRTLASGTPQRRSSPTRTSTFSDTASRRPERRIAGTGAGR